MRSLPLLATLCLATFASAQGTQIGQPAFASTFSGSLTRGFWFTCPVDCVLTELQVPNESSQPNQVVEVIDFGFSAPPTYPATAVGTTLFYNNSTAAGTWIQANVNLLAGHNIGILGACNPSLGSATSNNSYSTTTSGSYDTRIWGFPISLRRFGTQFGIASSGPGQQCWTENATVSRVLVRLSQEQAPMPAFSSTFTSSLTRGFYFQAPVTSRITSLLVPNESGQPNQVVEVIDFGGSAPPAYPGTATGTQLFYNNSTPAGTVIPCNVTLFAGRWYGVLGACNPSAGSATSANSYAGAGPFSGNIMGLYPFNAARLLTQSGIASNGGNQPCSSENAFNIGRVYVGFSGAGTTNGGNNDYYSTTTGWPAFGVSAPGPLNGIQVGSPSFTVNGPNSAAGGIAMALLNFGILAQPGTTCMAPGGGAFGGLPAVPACGGSTNLSWDLAQSPLGSFVFFYGTPNASGNISTTINIPGFAGVFGSTQAYVFDFVAGFGVSEAYNWRIVP
ncbi:MAG: hypothetical protein U1E73_01735 [Planctomycetota bacterium]